MPVSISEIGVKIAVDDGAEEGSAGADGKPGRPKDPCGGDCGQQLSDAQHRAIVEDSVRAVLETLQLREGR